MGNGSLADDLSIGNAVLLLKVNTMRGTKADLDPGSLGQHFPALPTLFAAFKGGGGGKLLMKTISQRRS